MNLGRWKRDWTLMSVFFTGDEIASFTEKLKGLTLNTLVFCSYENRFAKSGGLAAVTTNILPYLREVNNIPSVILMTPYHSKIVDRRKLKTQLSSFTVSYNRRDVAVEIYEYRQGYDVPCSGEIREYYLKADGFFEADNRLRDPYTYDADDTEQNSVIQADNALFFCKAVPYALRALNLTRDLVLHLHEWQTALVTLTSKDAMARGVLNSCGTVQTMHNSYDSSIPASMLMRVLNRKRSQKVSGIAPEELSAYRIGLQLLDGPLTTVSDHFARELTHDTIQTEHYAPHLQKLLATSGVYGVNNGMFTALSSRYPKGEDHSLEEVRDIKLKSRKALLRILASYKPDERFGDMTFEGRTISRLPEHVPILVMTGRLDPIQKGYFVLLRAIEQFAEDEVKVVLSPMPVHDHDLDYFYEVACKCKGNVTVFPIRMEKGYRELQTGATFGVMPSIYEPFGAAVEYMANGTVNIGRATGGLVDQIDRKCGYLFKEDPQYYTSQHMRDFVDTSEIIQVRKINPWAQSMADSLKLVIQKASDIYQQKPDAYYRMILQGFRQVRHFTWEESARKYFDVYSMISRK